MVQSELALAATPAVPPSTCTLYHGDCLDVMPTIEAGSVQMVFADLPYGTTKNRWDVCIDIQKYWTELNKCLAKKHWCGFTADMRLASILVQSNIKSFRHDIVWHKTGRPSGFLQAKVAPLRVHEHVLMFAKERAIYTPQMAEGKAYIKSSRSAAICGDNYPDTFRRGVTVNAGKRYPLSLLSLSRIEGAQLHPTQKPVALLEWLIATYTNLGDTVLDPCMGSGVTGVACARLGRNFIGIEKDETYFNVASKRIAEERRKLGLS